MKRGLINHTSLKCDDGGDDDTTFIVKKKSCIDDVRSIRCEDPHIPMELISIIFSYVTEYHAWVGMLSMNKSMSGILRWYGIEPFVVFMNLKYALSEDTSKDHFRRKVYSQSGIGQIVKILHYGTDAVSQGPFVLRRHTDTDYAGKAFLSIINSFISEFGELLYTYGAVVAGGSVIQSVIAHLARCLTGIKRFNQRRPYDWCKETIKKSLWPGSNLDQLRRIHDILDTWSPNTVNLNLDNSSEFGDIDIYVSSHIYYQFHNAFIHLVKQFVQSYFEVHRTIRKLPLDLHHHYPKNPLGFICKYYEPPRAKLLDLETKTKISEEPNYIDPSMNITNFDSFILSSVGGFKHYGIKFELIGTDLGIKLGEPVEMSMVASQDTRDRMHQFINKQFDLSFCSTYFDGKRVVYPDYMGPKGLFNLQGVGNSSNIRRKFCYAMTKYFGVDRDILEYTRVAYARCPHTFLNFIFKIGCKRFHKYIRRGFQITNADEVRSIAIETIKYEDDDLTIQTVFDEDFRKTSKERKEKGKWKYFVEAKYGSNDEENITRLIDTDHPNSITMRFSICGRDDCFQSASDNPRCYLDGKLCPKYYLYHRDGQFCPMAGLYIIIKRRNWEYHWKKWQDIERGDYYD